MITKDQLTNYKKALGFTLQQVEIDYVQHIFLYFLSKVNVSVVFKGGTCLQKTRGLNRFSDDLDFTLHQDKMPTGFVESICNDVNLFGYPASIRKKKETEASIKHRVVLEGPLFNGSPQSKSSLVVDISTREKVLEPPKENTITPIYPDILPYSILTMAPEEIIAEKIRALFTRDKARDLYDLWFLLKKTDPPQRSLINKKLEYYDLSVDKKALEKKIMEKEEVWEAELNILLASVPGFKTVEKRVKDKLGKVIKE